MKLFKLFLVALALTSTPLLITACDQNSSLEEGAEEVSDEIDDATTN